MGGIPSSPAPRPPLPPAPPPPAPPFLYAASSALLGPASGSAFTLACPGTAVVSSLAPRGGSGNDFLAATCSDGTALAGVGNAGGGNLYALSCGAVGIASWTVYLGGYQGTKPCLFPLWQLLVNVSRRPPTGKSHHMMHRGA